jgi:hypothetical protein
MKSYRAAAGSTPTHDALRDSNAWAKAIRVGAIAVLDNVRA